MRLFEGVLRFARTGSGDVNALHGDMAGAFRLRLGDRRVLAALERIGWREKRQSDRSLRGEKESLGPSR